MEVISAKPPLVTLRFSSSSINLDHMKTLQWPEQEDILTDPKWQTKLGQHSLAQEIRALSSKVKILLAISLPSVITWLRLRDAINHQRLENTWAWFLNIREEWTTGWLSLKVSSPLAKEIKWQLSLRLLTTAGLPHPGRSNSLLNLTMTMFPVTKHPLMRPKKKNLRGPSSRLSPRHPAVSSRPSASSSFLASKLPLPARIWSRSQILLIKITMMNSDSDDNTE